MRCIDGDALYANIVNYDGKITETVIKKMIIQAPTVEPDNDLYPLFEETDSTEICGKKKYQCIHCGFTNWMAPEDVYAMTADTKDEESVTTKICTTCKHHTKEWYEEPCNSCHGVNDGYEPID